MKRRTWGIVTAAAVAVVIALGTPGIANADSYATTQHGVELVVINNPSSSGGQQAEICNFQSATNAYKFWMNTADGNGRIDVVVGWQTGYNWVYKSGSEFVVTLASGYCQGFTFSEDDNPHASASATAQSGSNWRFTTPWISYN